MTSSSLAPPAPAAHWIVEGFRFRWRTLLLIAAINTALAVVLWIPDDRPFWHPLVTVHGFGFAIAYFVNAMKPWQRASPLRWLLTAVGIGSVVGLAIVVLVKGYTLAEFMQKPSFFLLTLVSAFGNGLLISLIFHTRYREIRAAEALHRAEAEHYRLSKQAVEAELKLMQAQVEPHFLFNTLASVQFLVETDPAAANRLLGHLIAYLRAALPQLRASSSTLEREFALAREYLSILKMRMGERLVFETELPDALRSHPFPPNMLISLVENAIQHGVEPAAAGGRVTIRASQRGGDVQVEVADTGRGLGASARAGGQGVGLANVRERLAALFGGRGRFALEAGEPSGVRAIIVVPHEP